MPDPDPPRCDYCGHPDTLHGDSVSDGVGKCGIWGCDCPSFIKVGAAVNPDGRKYYDVTTGETSTGEPPQPGTKQRSRFDAVAEELEEPKANATISVPRSRPKIGPLNVRRELAEIGKVLGRDSYVMLVGNRPLALIEHAWSSRSDYGDSPGFGVRDLMREFRGTVSSVRFKVAGIWQLEDFRDATIVVRISDESTISRIEPTRSWIESGPVTGARTEVEAIVLSA